MATIEHVAHSWGLRPRLLYAAPPGLRPMGKLALAARLVIFLLAVCAAVWAFWTSSTPAIVGKGDPTNIAEYNRLRLGMTPAEVEMAIGRPPGDYDDIHQFKPMMEPIGVRPPNRFAGRHVAGCRRASSMSAGTYGATVDLEPPLYLGRL